MKIAINGMGHVGRGVLAALGDFPELELCGIFTRRPGAVAGEVAAPIWHIDEAEAVSRSGAAPEVVIMCGGSADDLPLMSPRFAGLFNIVDSFDDHAALPRHIAALDAAARAAGRLAVTGAGWDPGVMSLARLYFAALLPRGQTLTQWGPGVSRGHTEVLSRLPGVARAVQLTVPAEIGEAGFSGERSTPQQLHRRECFIVPQPGADRAELERRLRAHPYFAGYETQVSFVDGAELDALLERLGDRHAGRVMHVFDEVRNEAGEAAEEAPRPAKTMVEAPRSAKPEAEAPCSAEPEAEVPHSAEPAEGATHSIKSAENAPHSVKPAGASRPIAPAGGSFRLSLGLELRSNARFTGAVLCATARAVGRLHRCGRIGCLTLADLPPALLAGRDILDMGLL